MNDWPRIKRNFKQEKQAFITMFFTYYHRKDAFDRKVDAFLTLCFCQFHYSKVTVQLYRALLCQVPFKFQLFCASTHFYYDHYGSTLFMQS